MKIYRLSNQIEGDTPLTFEEYIEWEQDISEEVLKQLIDRYRLPVFDFKQVVKISEGGKDFWFANDTDSNLYSLIDISDWILNLDETEALNFLDITEDNIYVSDMGFLGDVRSNPGEVYHYTTEEALEDIQSSGFLRPSRGTGLGNRGSHGVFVSVDPEEYALGTYGNILLKIDLERFKNDIGAEALNIDIEPEIKESIIRGSIAHKLGVEIEFDSPNDVSINTLIVNHIIPIKYISIDNK